MAAIVKISVVLESIVSWIGKIASWLCVPLFLIIVFDVVTRKLNLIQGTFLDGWVTSTKLQEMEWHLHAALFLLVLAYAYFQDGHVRIDLVRDRLNARTKAWIEIIGCLIFLIPYAAMVVFYSSDFWYKSWVIDEGSAATTGLPHRYIIKATLPIAFGLLFLAGVSMVLNRIAFLAGHRVPDHHGADDAHKPHGE
ncbi:MAG: TRAP transporter small permease subunit [Geminicoccaceae bacterium]